MWHRFMDWLDFGPPWQVWGVIVSLVGIGSFFWWRKERRENRLRAAQDARHTEIIRLTDRILKLQNRERSLLDQQLSPDAPAMQMVHIDLVVALEAYLAVDESEHYRHWHSHLLSSLASPAHKRH